MTPSKSRPLKENGLFINRLFALTILVVYMITIKIVSAKCFNGDVMKKFIITSILVFGVWVSVQAGIVLFHVCMGHGTINNLAVNDSVMVIIGLMVAFWLLLVATVKCIDKAFD